MIDEKKLIEDLEKQFKSLIPEDHTDFCKIWQIGQDIKIIERQPQFGGWTPVSERLPNEAGNYLVTSKGCTWVANWFSGTWWGIEKKCRWTDVEAWMPLPEPYKESEK